jgi:hypothetical protein
MPMSFSLGILTIIVLVFVALAVIAILFHKQD